MNNQDEVALRLLRTPFNEMQTLLYRRSSNQHVSWREAAKSSNTVEFLSSHGWGMRAFSCGCKAFLTEQSDHLGIQIMSRAFAEYD